GAVQRNRAYLCPCSQRFGGVCEGCGRLLADVLEGGDLGVTSVRCDQCGRVYPFVEAPRVCEDEAASAYDRAFARVSTHFLPFLLRAARLEVAQRVLDAATGTGIAAKAALGVVGPGGHVTAADISPAMVDRARQRLAGSPNTSVVVSDGQS